MGGTIGVQSEAGSGSTFFFTIPVFFSLNAGDLFALPVRLKDLRVLVVDDNPTACMIGTAMLIDWSMQVESASSGRAALDKIEQADANGRPFDLVVMDWRMPGLDGLQAAHRIMNNDVLTRRPAVIMVSAYGDEDLSSRATAAGVSVVLAKPFSPSQLFDCVVSLFGGTSRPSAPQSGDEVRAFTPKNFRLRGARILVVEDNAINRQIAVELLGRVGVLVDTAENGREATDRVLGGETTYDAVLMDVQMPVMDGLTATGLIREQYRQGSLPVIAMTAHAMEHERRRCLDAGMDDHVVKPVDPEALYDTLARWVRPGHSDATETAVQPVESGAFDLAACQVARDIDSLFEAPQPNAATSILPEELPPFNLTRALERVSGDAEFLKMLIISFRENFADAGAEMRRLLEGQELEEAYRLAHTVKGAAGSLDATSLFLAARDLEQALRPMDIDVMSAAFETALADTLAAAATLKDDASPAD